jgi:uncharacterized protein
MPTNPRLPSLVARVFRLAAAVGLCIVGAATQAAQLPEDLAPVTPAPVSIQSLPGDVPVPADTGFEPPPVLVPRAPRVALILPLTGRQQALGTAVRDGFLAGHFATAPERRLEVLVFDDAKLGVNEAYRRALEAGATIIAGPLLRESVQAIAGVAGQIPVLALNFLPDGQPVPAAFWQFGLAPEDEARAVAALAIARNQRRAVSLVPDSDWGRRLGNAFAAEYLALGGEVLATGTYFPGKADLSPVLRRLLKAGDDGLPVPRPEPNPDQSQGLDQGQRPDVDLIFLAANAAAGRQIAPQLRFFGAGDVPTYSTSAIWEEGGRDATDLNGIMFPDSPWVISPDSSSRAAKDAVVRHWGRQALNVSRFYALGYDAYGLLPLIGAQPQPGPFITGELEGTTGRLNADATGRMHRRLAWAQIQDGLPAPFPTADGPMFPGK